MLTKSKLQLRSLALTSNPERDIRECSHNKVKIHHSRHSDGNLSAFIATEQKGKMLIKYCLLGIFRDHRHV